jgi:transcription antitermination factor NusG
MRSSENGQEIPNQNSNGDWHALYTRHQHEKSVAQILASKSHEVFLPLIGTTHQWRDRAKQLCLPLFPSYVFIRGGLDRRVQVLSTPGLIHVVGWAGHPAIIPQDQIDAVRQMIESLLHVESHPFLQSGDRVRVEAGPLKGIEGVLVRKKNKYRLVVSVDLLGSSAAVEIDNSSVKRIDGLTTAARLHSVFAMACP